MRLDASAPESGEALEGSFHPHSRSSPVYGNRGLYKDDQELSYISSHDTFLTQAAHLSKKGEFHINELADRNQSVWLDVRRCEWGAIWAGVFIFTAIWVVFGTLGTAIFASAGISTSLSVN